MALVAVAALAGAGLSGRGAGRRELWLAAAAGALLVISVVHLLPDAWHEAPETGIPRWAVPAAALVSFILAGLVARKGCPCEPEKAGGLGGAAALAIHRFLEGSALALTSPIAVVGTLAVHALAEGVAVGALLRSQPRRQMAAALAAMCLGPALGAAAAGLLPAVAEAVLVALAAGVLAQAAWVSAKTAVHLAPTGGLLTIRPVVAGLAAAAVTALAVLLAG